jgi:chlorite dismutase
MRFHSYIFFSIRPEFSALSSIQQKKYKKNFLVELENEKNVITYSYATLGLKANTTILFWMQADSIEGIQNYLNSLLHTDLGKYLTIIHTLFGMTRPTQYSRGSTGHLDTTRKGGAYLTIYPFTKTYEWYTFDLEKRKELMEGHIAIGRKFPQITQLLLYSYGVDDQEFIVSYETDDLSDFQTLVMELRSDQVREYTKSDTPIFTCVYKSFEEILEFV